VIDLAYTREPVYLSPSSFLQFDGDPLTFYIERLGPRDLRPAREQQGFAAGVGTAFDEWIKAGWEGVAPDFAGVECAEPARAIDLGVQVGLVYVESGAWGMLQSEGQIVGMESDLYGVIPGTDVPIRGKLDTNWDGLRAHDFKVRGGNQIRDRESNISAMTALLEGASMGEHAAGLLAEEQKLGVACPGTFAAAANKVKTPSPNPGYVRHYTRDGLTQGKKGSHKRSGEAMEDLNVKWAIQLSIYSWLLNGRIGQCAAAIDQLVPQPDGDVRICQFRTYISARFQETLAARMVAAWDSIQSRSVIDTRIPLELQLLRRDSTPFWKKDPKWWG